MISNELVKSALITKVDTTPEIQAYFPSGTILEYSFQGTDWTYPCARLQLDPQIDSVSGRSCPSTIEFSWYIFSEKQSSKEADQIAGVFVSVFRDLSFTRNGIKFSGVQILENIPAIKQDVRTWRAQVRCRSLLNHA